MKNEINLWIHKIIALFNQGLEPLEIFQSLLISFLFTIIPIPGITAIIVTPIALNYKLNIPIMMGFSYIFAPLQFILLLPFIRIGEYVLQTDHTLLSVEAIVNSFNNSFWITLKELSLEVICALSGWALISFPTLFVIYFLGRLFIGEKINIMKKNIIKKNTK
ncbi:MAG: DUF2062 domain-containing protein [Bacteroidetes bacterium]|nr:DUF2062 domain-containing protein [Bacteroidota bacterium]